MIKGLCISDFLLMHSPLFAALKTFPKAENKRGGTLSIMKTVERRERL